jgi:hypothetical protein
MSYSSVVLADLPGSGSFWPMSDTADPVVDSGGGAHNGTSFNTPTFSQPGPLSPDASASIGFAAASNEGVGFGDFFGFTGASTFSLEFWLNPNVGSAAINPFVLAKRTSLTGWEVRYLAAGQIRLQRGGGAGFFNTCTSVSLIPTSAWSHVIFTYDATNGRCYLNGNLDQTGATEANSLTGNAIQVCAANYDPAGSGNSFDGRISNISIYPSVVLTGAQAAAHFAAGFSTAAMGLRDDKNRGFGPF